MNSTLLRHFIREIIIESSENRAPARYTPKEIFKFRFSSGFEGLDTNLDSYYFGKFPILNFYSADNENEVIIELSSNYEPDAVSSVKSMNASLVPAKYWTNPDSTFMKDVNSNISSKESKDRILEIIKNVKDDSSLKDSKTYNKTQRFFVITSSTNPNFKYVAGEQKPSFTTELSKLFSELIANPLEGYGIYVTNLPQVAQDESIKTLTALQTSLSFLTAIPGYGRIAAAANLGPSLALASIYHAKGKSIDPNQTVNIPVINVEVGAKKLNNFSVGAYVVAGIIGCFGGLHQAISEVNKLNQVRALSGLPSLTGTNLNTLGQFRTAYTALGNSTTLVANYSDDVGAVVTTARSGWQAVAGGYVYVTGAGNSWVNNTAKAGIIASNAGKAIVFTQREVEFINSLINGGNYLRILTQMQNVASGTGTVMVYIGIAGDALGAIIDVITLKDIVEEYIKTDPPKDALPIKDPEVERAVLISRLSSTYDEAKAKYAKITAGKANWDDYTTSQGFTTIINLTTGARKIVNQIKIDSKNCINDIPGKEFFPKVFIVNDEIYKTFEVISKLPNSFNPPKNYFWKGNNTGSVFLVLSKSVL